MFSYFIDFGKLENRIIHWIEKSKVDIDLVSKAISDYMKKNEITEDDVMRKFCYKFRCTLKRARRFLETNGFGNYSWLWNHCEVDMLFIMRNPFWNYFSITSKYITMTIHNSWKLQARKKKSTSWAASVDDKSRERIYQKRE